MIDAVAVARKEWLELLGKPGMRGKQGIMLFILAFGVVLPLMNGPTWITSPTIAITWSWVPMFLVASVISDAFAGERERHTLETLLATRLSDSAILFGKIGAAIAYAGAMTAVSLIMGIVTVNLANRQGGLVLYSLGVVMLICLLGLLGALLVAAIGVLISLRSATVRQAQQTLSGAIVLLAAGPILLVRFLPAGWQHRLASSGLSAEQIALLAMTLFFAIDAGALTMARARFRRGRLIAV
jgi:ABC-2 type transport system permease protein